MCARNSNSTHRTCNGPRTTINNGPHRTTQKMDNLSSKNHTKTGGELKYSGRAYSSCSINRNRHVNHVMVNIR